ncbi:hypothetical protein LEP1GSC017_1716 [Leptospira meyeri serovar Hardjo str. Went 5]|nr:hypothetical protein LEP1GSC017_1716 [Leptospira meyeri serovar Hardjo str. Went 5]EMJ88293.1 hypothetical protein LEP1GSC196_1696 [Leptospira meyeri serovar Semaranga str. Veldrot Semarang 173]
MHNNQGKLVETKSRINENVEENSNFNLVCFFLPGLSP